MGLGRDLDWLCRRAALAGATWIPTGTPLFINCGVSGLIDPVHRVDQMLLVLDAVKRSPSDVVMEITERELVGDLNRLRQVVNTYRGEGFRFAIDDVGEGHSTLEVLATTEPEFIKVARSLVVESANRGGRAAIRAVVAFAIEMNADVIAEGIEHTETADYLQQLGVKYGQGWAFGRPAFPRFDGGNADDEARMRDAAAKVLLTR
jgi:EAL domain-containing protein (putative c-di-GMP-specific phosphodiesterase class I)